MSSPTAPPSHPVHRAAPATAGSPAARAALSRVQDGCTSGVPVRIWIGGTASSGKSSVLAAAVDMFRGAGIIVRGFSDSSDDPPAAAALVVDDVQALDPDRRRRLADLIRRHPGPVLVAGETRDHDDAEVFDAVRLDGTTVSLAPLSTAQIVERSTAIAPSGAAITPAVAAVVRRRTGGLVGTVDVVLAALMGATPDADSAELVARVAAGHQHRMACRLDGTTLSVLALAGLGAGTDTDSLSRALHLDQPTVVGALDRARSSGFLSDGDSFLAPALTVLAAVLGPERFTALRKAALDVRLRHGTLTEAEAVGAARAGLADPRLADLLVRYAGAGAPATAVTLLDAALTAGADPAETRVLLAEALGLAGETDRAVDLTDELLAEPAVTASPALLENTVRVAAAVASARGHHTHAADLYRWLGTDRSATDSASAVVALVAVGDRAAAEAVISPHDVTGGAPTATPTGARNRGRLVATGLLGSLSGSAAAALGPLLRSASGTVTARAGATRVDVESPVVMAALLAIHAGDLAAARDLLERADDPARPDAVRIGLLRAWTAMAAGDLSLATEILDEVTTSSRASTAQADRVLAFALRLGMARRRGDAGALAAAWRLGPPLLAELDVHLFGLLPLGEIRLAADRLDEAARVARHVNAADRLLADLGDPPAWGTWWRWCGLQAAILRADATDVDDHLRRLAACSTDEFAAVLTAAGRIWRQLLTSDGGPGVDPAEVADAARDLERFGLGWDAGRLAGEAALRAGDTGTATALLQTARTVAGPGGGDSDGVLTEREAEVARELLQGLTYREIGARLFISAKTVEHHVARIRRRVDAGSRSELLSTLRGLGYGN
ncbi:helix-turn-helix transcriptional regulator [Williamsia sterculiae]|uniref:Regulatory protein, luxR family n=1 Tax=Williamsia sterculiae TaxID=1344003 RepID=A0A1N7CJB2_9NOCA|nr:helix-turn-helix transcriptional regulator [Williamsia sterculiae]SIR63711.1 regulatory protein, luxR family [Williamsia sterculiae]